MKTTTLAIVFLAAFAAVAAAGPCTNGEAVTPGLTCTLTDTLGDVFTFAFSEVTAPVSLEIPAVPAPPGGFLGVDLGFEIASSETTVQLEYEVTDSATNMIAIINGLPNSTPVTDDWTSEEACTTAGYAICTAIVAGSGTFNGPVALPVLPTNTIFIDQTLLNTGTPPVSSFSDGFEVAPEPSAMFLMAAGLSCLGSLSWKLRRR